MHAFRYTNWDPRRHGKPVSTFAKLLDIFQQLLMFTGGDIEETFKWLNELDARYGLTDEGLTMADFIEELKRQGYLESDPQGFVHLTARTERSLRQRSLEEIFSQLSKSARGGHRTVHTGGGFERQPETRPWTFGDDIHNMDVTGTLKNAYRRSGLDEFRLNRDDFEMFETDHHATCATVLMIDLSHSMILYGEDRITPARKTAMALVELILTRYPRDTVDLVAFGDEAWEVSVKDLPYLQVGPYHTNTRAGLQLARSILSRRRNRNKQIFLITDGKPSAQSESDGRLYQNSFGLDRRIVNKVFDEAVICRREGITITTFMIANDPYLQRFVRTLTEANQGRAYYAGLGDLGEFVFEDYVRNRRRRVR